MSDKKNFGTVKHSVSNLDRKSEKAKDIEVVSRKTTIAPSSSSIVHRSRGTFSRLASRFANRVYNVDTGMSFVKFIFIVFFTIAISSYLLNGLSGTGQGLTFTSLLNHLSTASEGDSFSLSAYFYTLREVLRITSDWGLFNFIRDFLNIILSGIGFLVSAIGGLFDILFFLYDLFFVLI